MSDETSNVIETPKDGTFNEVDRKPVSYGGLSNLISRYGNSAVPNVLCISDGAKSQYFALSKEEAKNIIPKLAPIGVSYAANPSKEIQKLTKFDDISDMFSKFAQIANAVSGESVNNSHEGVIFASPDLKEYPVVSGENFGGNNTPLEFDLKLSIGDLDAYDFNKEILEPLSFFLSALPNPTGNGWKVPLPTSMDILSGLARNLQNNQIFDKFSQNFDILEMAKGGIADTFENISVASQKIKDALVTLLWENTSMVRYTIEVGYFGNSEGPSLDGSEYSFHPIIVSRKMGISKVDFEWGVDLDKPIFYNDANDENTIVDVRSGYLPNSITIKLQFKPLAVVATSSQLYHPIRVQ